MIHGQLDTDLLDYSHFFVFLQLLEAQQEKSLRLLRMFWVKSRQILPICRYPFLSRCVSEQWFTCISLLTVCSSEIGLYFSYVIYLLEVNLFFLQIQDNISLLCQTRDNILRVLKEYVLKYCCVYSNMFDLRFICSDSFVSTC